MFRTAVFLCIASTASTYLLSAQSFEQRALRISSDIQARHLPFGTVLSPVFNSPESTDIISYSRCGDSAIWTGHHLAAESFRYAVTRTPEALAAARKALQGIDLLVKVSGPDKLLARCVLRADSRFSAGPREEEKQHGEYRATVGDVDYYWIGHTSRDQYLGVFFGLSVAYEHLPQDRPLIRDIVTRLLDGLLEDNWAVLMPGGDLSTVFWLRPDQQLSMLQVGRQVNPDRFRQEYENLRRRAFGVGTVIGLEGNDDHGSYFKFNLSAITLYNLLRLEEESSRRGDYISVYRTYRSTVADHGNAFFNVIDRALIGPNAQRDAETIRLLTQWTERPTRDFWVDLRGKYRACDDDRACDPIPVPERVRTDFLWQRSPYLLYGGGSGRIESPGIDFILPYWMGRFYGLNFGPVAASAASGTPGLAPESIASLFGVGIPALGGSVTVTDQSGVSKPALVLFSNSEQINFVVPGGLIPGPARIAVAGGQGTSTAEATAEIRRVAPAVFTANATGKGVAAALAFRMERDGALTSFPVAQCTGPLCVARHIELGDDRPVYLSLFGTGIRGASSPGAVAVRVGGVIAPVQYAGPQPEFAGLDQVNVRLPASLSGKGEVDLELTVEGIAANVVRIGIQ